MADTAPTPVTPTEGAPDTGGEANLESQLGQFLVPEPEENTETEFAPGETPEPVEEPSEEKAEEQEAKPEEKAEEKKEEKQLWTVKVNGQEFDVDEAELIRGYQLGTAATQRFQEAKQLREEANQVLQMLQKDPISVLTHPALGINFRKVAEEYLLEQIKMEKADPQTRAQMEAERKFQELQRKTAELEQQQYEAEVQRQAAAAAEQIDASYTKALANGKVPKTPTVIRRMAELNSQMLEQGYDPSAEELVDLVRQEIIQANREVLGKMDPEEVKKLVGEEKMKEVRKAEIAKVKPTTQRQQLKQFKPQPQQTTKRYVSEKDLREHVKSVLGKR